MLPPPPPPPPEADFRYSNGTNDRLDLDDGQFLDAKSLAKAWRVNEGNWKVEPNAAAATVNVISWLLKQSPTDIDEDSVARSSRHLATPEMVGSRKLKPVPGSQNLYVDTNIPNPEKVKLIKTVVEWIRSETEQLGTAVNGFSLETWLPTGPLKPKRPKSP